MYDRLQPAKLDGQFPGWYFAIKFTMVISFTSSKAVASSPCVTVWEALNFGGDHKHVGIRFDRKGISLFCSLYNNFTDCISHQLNAGLENPFLPHLGVGSSIQPKFGCLLVEQYDDLIQHESQGPGMILSLDLICETEFAKRTVDIDSIGVAGIHHLSIGIDDF